ncbi:MAG TPA: protein kinase, partial [Vicinamibacterales bacterium]|nr:protein kinase [Vicinamibacterales bacterium]
MSLASGTRLGVYEILGPIGAGGMGEVYRARDTKLNRDVAIKVLPELFAADPDRLARFEREAQTLAALNHPHIAQIYGVEESGQTAALVMELVEGEDLAQRIARAGAIPVDESIAIATQIADALESAHDRNIVHRDLKPANVKVAPGGAVKVLDFGLAKAMEPSSGISGLNVNSPTVTSPALMTHAGVIIGTAAYMAPEQARGKPADRRADVWAFGCVLYELLTARRPFDGETMTDVLSAIVSKEPDWTLLPAATPIPVLHLLHRCLDKDPRRRLQAIGEARIALDAPVEPPRAANTPVRRVHPIGIAALIVLGTAIAALAGWGIASRRQPSPSAPAWLSIPLAPADTLAGGFGLSPDGTQFAFVGELAGKRQIFVRRLDRDLATALGGTDNPSTVGPVFSPDGKWLAFTSVGTLKKVPVDGGPVITLAPASGTTRPAWGANDVIVFTNPSSGLSRISPAGGTAEVLTTLDPAASEMAHEMPWILPDGKTLLFGVRRSAPSARSGSASIVALSLETGTRRELFPGMVLGLVGPNQLMIARGEDVLAVPFDTERLVATGEETAPVPGMRSVRRVGFSTTPLFAVAGNGTMVFLTIQGGEDDSPMMLVDQAGAATRVAVPLHRYMDPRLSPDGTRIAAHVFEDGRDNWVVDLRRGSFMRLTFDPGEDETPIWSPD